jgi:guanylate kinase
LASGRGRLIVIAGPSGVGKGSVVKGLLARDPEGLALSVSVTTRSPRPGERDGVDYQFVSDEAFDQMVARDALLEWAEVVGHRSGTPRDIVDRKLRAGRDVILEIDVQGARQIRERVPGALLIFLAPPSRDELERRLRGRGTESEERIAVRLATADEELAQRSWFDHVVVNDRLQRAIGEVAAIIQASREASSRPASEERLP